VKALLLGGNGFIGSHLALALDAANWDVTIYDRALRPFEECPASVHYVRGEMGNRGLLHATLPGIDVVFHLVSTTIPKTSNDDPAYDVLSNVVETIHLLQTCVQTGVRQVIFISSGGTVYGIPQCLPVAEDHPTAPISSYGITKLMIEKYLELFRHLYGLEYVVLRPSNPFGERQHPLRGQGVVLSFLYRLRWEEPLQVWGDGSVVRDFFYVSDLVGAFMEALQYKGPPRVFNIGSGQGLSLNELIAVIERVAGREATVQYTPGRRFDVPALVLDIRRAREHLGWRPLVSLEEGLTNTWRWVQTLPRLHEVG